jgi:hypothetical protein
MLLKRVDGLFEFATRLLWCQYLTAGRLISSRMGVLWLHLICFVNLLSTARLPHHRSWPQCSPSTKQCLICGDPVVLNFETKCAEHANRNSNSTRQGRCSQSSHAHRHLTFINKRTGHHILYLVVLWRLARRWKKICQSAHLKIDGQSL